MTTKNCYDLIEAEASQSSLEGYTNFNYFEDKDMDIELMTCKKSKTLYIVFRGSDSNANWFYNFLFFPKRIKPYENKSTKITVHYGFYLSYTTKAREFIHKIAVKEKNIVVLGYSLGGAMAMLCAVDLQYNFKCNVECYTFGSPRVGNKYFMESYNKRVPSTCNFKNGNDIVTHLPPLLFGFKTTGKLIQLGEKKFFPSGKDHQLEKYKQFDISL
jgi:predicted lipase